MKTNLLKHLWLFMFPLLIGCGDKDEPMGIPSEAYNILMFVTNNAGDDLVQNSDKYYQTRNKFSFDTWKIYLDGELIQTANEENKYHERDVNYLLEVEIDRKNIRLDSNLEIQKRIEDYSEKHVAEYVVSSLSLFGDTEEHNIRIEFRGIENDFGFYTAKEYFISVDDIKQEVYYPEDWKDLFPKSQYETVMYPYFVLNVDTL